MNRARRRPLAFLAACVAAAGSLVATTAEPAPAGPADPSIAYSVKTETGGVGVVTATLDGTVVQRFPDAEEWSSLAGGIATVTRHTNVFRSSIVGLDAATGAERFVVRDARLPLLTPDGTGLVFQPDNAGTLRPNERDPYVQSIWYRDLATGSEFKLAQFFGPDRGILQKAVSAQGDRVAFTRGNDTFLLEWNVWIVNTDGTGLFQITGDDVSAYPSFHPNGESLAISKLLEGPCSGALATIGADGRDEHVFFRSTCGMDLQRPIWIGPHRVIAIRWRHNDRGARPVGLVEVDVHTGAAQQVVDGYIGDLAVSRRLGRVAFRLGSGPGRIGLYAIDTGDVHLLPRTGEFLARVELDGAGEDAV